jgi:hypothetical protein
VFHYVSAAGWLDQLAFSHYYQLSNEHGTSAPNPSKNRLIEQAKKRTM